MHRIVGILITGMIQVSSSFSYALTIMPEGQEIPVSNTRIEIGCFPQSPVKEESLIQIVNGISNWILSGVAIIIVLNGLYVALRMFSTRNDKEHYQYRLKNMKRTGIALIITGVLWVVVGLMLYVINVVTM